MISQAIKDQYALMRSGFEVVNDTSKPRQWVRTETLTAKMHVEVVEEPKRIFPIIRKKKTCYKCRQEKPINEFHKSKKELDGHNNYCKECVNANWIEWKKINERKTRNQ